MNNHTDRTIKVKPDTVSSVDYAPFEEERIGKGSSHVFYINGIDYEPDMEVEYNGIIREFDVDVDFWGYDTINVEMSHFVSGNG